MVGAAAFSVLAATNGHGQRKMKNPGNLYVTFEEDCMHLSYPLIMRLNRQFNIDANTLILHSLKFLHDRCSTSTILLGG